MDFRIGGQIREKESGLPVKGLKVRAYDKDLIWDDLLGTAITDQDGRFELDYSSKDFQELLDARPDVYLMVYAPPRRLLMSTAESVRVGAREREHFELEIGRDALGPFSPVAPEGAPLPDEMLEGRTGREATAGLPDVRIELDRVYPDGDRDLDLTLRRDEESGALLIEAPFLLMRRKFPPIAAEALDREKVSAIGSRSELDGFAPDHLAVRFRPALIERPRHLAHGLDLPNSVFAPDTRFIFQDSSFPWCTTGRVETEGGGCTGTMIGRRLMLTANHCIVWNANGAGWLKFTPSYYNGDAPFGIAWATRVIYWTRVDGSDGLSDTETAFDYVVIVLDRNMGDLTGYAGYRTYSSSWNGGGYWQQIGYPGDLSGGQRPAFSGGGAVTSVEQRSTAGQDGFVLGNFIDTFPGHSGGPYWGWWDGEPWPRVVGTDSTSPRTPGNDTSGDNEAGGGPALSSLIAWARSNYP